MKRKLTNMLRGKENINAWNGYGEVEKRGRLEDKRTVIS